MATPPSARTLRAVTASAALLALTSAVAAVALGLAAARGRPPPRAQAPALRPLDPDQAELSGTVRRLVGTQVSGPVLALPLTFEVERGGGTKATFSGGAVAGRPQVVLWDGGRPLALSGRGALDLAGQADVELTGAGARWTIDGSARTLTTGTYRFSAPVAVGTTGLANPREGVVLEVATTATVATKGHVTVVVPVESTTLAGPGALLVEGDLRLRTSSGTVEAGAVRFGPGPFELALSRRPDGSGFSVDRSLLQGEVTTGA